jgi:hypothetical protein
VTVLGRGITVGRPIGLLLTRRSENATVTLCHTGTRDVEAAVRRADVVIVAAGVPGLVKADWVKPGAASWTSASPAPTPGWSATSTRRCGRSPATWRPCRAGWGR